MIKPLFINIIAVGLLTGCGPPHKAPIAPTMTQDEAMAYCRGRIDEASRPKTRVGVGIGIGSGGKVSTKGGVAIGIDVSSDANKNKRYQNCVLENSGEAPSDQY